MSSTKLFAVVSILLGVTAIVVPYFFGTLAVMALGGVMLASGIVALIYVKTARKQGVPASVFGPWAQVIIGAVILIWPELALWLVAILLGGGLILGFSGRLPCRGCRSCGARSSRRPVRLPESPMPPCRKWPD